MTRTKAEEWAGAVQFDWTPSCTKEMTPIITVLLLLTVTDDYFCPRPCRKLYPAWRTLTWSTQVGCTSCQFRSVPGLYGYNILTNLTLTRTW